MSSNPSKGPFVDAEPARRHIRNLMSAGVSVVRIAATADISTAVISRALYSCNGNPPSRHLRKANADRLLAVKAADVVTGYVNSTGTRRRIQALMAKGWPQVALGQHFGCHPRYVTHLTLRSSIYGTTAAKVAAAYDRLWNKEPLEHGVTLSARNWVRNYARTHEWAPPAAWDDDTIDDPNAHPEWTGYCGTDRGFWTHRLQKIPGCARCNQAHEEWLAEHAHLDGRARNKLAFAQRSTAASREAELAEDGRELMRLGADYEQAAARLGVTRNHLQQAMLRHPEQLPAAA